MTNNYNFTISDVKGFQNELNLLKTIVKGKNRIPVLDCIKIELQNDKIVLTGTDLDNTLQSEFFAETMNTGAFCVELAPLLNAAKKATRKIEVYITDDFAEITPEQVETELKHTISRFADSGFNEREAITIDTAYKMQIERNEFPAGYNIKDVKKNDAEIDCR